MVINFVPNHRSNETKEEEDARIARWVKREQKKIEHVEKKMERLVICENIRIDALKEAKAKAKAEAKVEQDTKEELDGKSDDEDDDVESITSVLTMDLKCKYGGNYRKLCNEPKCEICPLLSFANHPLARLWDYTKNSDTPRDVLMRSRLKRWFICDVCPHSYYKILDKMYDHTIACPYCSTGGSALKLCEDPKCEWCFNKSFFSYMTLNLIWSETNIGTPRDYLPNSMYQATFECKTCNHKFKSRLHDVSSEKASKHYCPYCNSKDLCTNSDCKFCEQQFMCQFRSMPNLWDQTTNVETQRQTTG